MKGEGGMRGVEGRDWGECGMWNVEESGVFFFLI